MIKRLLGAFLALVALSLTGKGLWVYGNEAGYARGLTDYHNMCYHGGMVVIEEKVVICAPLTSLPKNEVPLDKGRET